MNMKNDIKDFKIDISKISQSLLEKQPRIKKYFAIMDKFSDPNFKEDVEFRKLFNDFYKIRQRPKEFYDLLYFYLENKKNTNVKYEDILNYFQVEYGSLEKSFSSKVLATINPDMPVWDSEVLKKLDMTAPTINTKNRFEKTVEMYYEIVEWYKEYMETYNAKEAINEFDKVFQNNEVTRVKKIDLILWSIRN